jgi:hypothetical protein
MPSSSSEVPQRDEQVISEVIYKTISLVCDQNLEMKNFQAAKMACKDLEILQRSDANTYLMKLRVLLNQLAHEPQHSQLMGEL